MTQDQHRGLDRSNHRIVAATKRFACYVCPTNIPNSNLVRGDDKETVTVMMAHETREVSTCLKLGPESVYPATSEPVMS
jgi:hypothetical protein